MENLKSKSIEAKKTIRLYILLSAIRTLSTSFVVAIFFVFMMERGLNIPEISAVALVVSATVFIFEIPTGIIADVFGRKISYVCSCFLMTLSLFVYMISNSFAIFLIAAIFNAISGTLSSGAFKAWLVDSLKHNDCLTPLSSIDIRKDQIGYSVGIIGAIFGSFLADKNIAFPWIAGILVMLSAGIIAIIFMKEEYFCKQRFSLAEKIKLKENIIKTSIEYAKNNKAVKFLLLMGLLQSFAIQAPIIQYQLFFDQFLPDKTALGFLWSAAAIFTIVGTTLSRLLLKKLRNNYKNTLVLSQIGIGLGILFLGIFPFPISLLAFLFWKFTIGTFDPISSEYLNKNIPSESRATLISFEAMAFSVGMGAGLISSGLMTKYFSIPMIWTFLGGLLIVFTLLIMRNGNNKIKNEAT